MSDSPTPVVIPGPFSPLEWLHLLACVSSMLDSADPSTPAGYKGQLSAQKSLIAVWRVLGHGDDVDQRLREIGVQLDAVVDAEIDRLGLADLQNPDAPERAERN